MNTACAGTCPSYCRHPVSLPETYGFIDELDRQAQTQSQGVSRRRFCGLARDPIWKIVGPRPPRNRAPQSNQQAGALGPRLGMSCTQALGLLGCGARRPKRAQHIFPLNLSAGATKSIHYLTGAFTRDIGRYLENTNCLPYHPLWETGHASIGDWQYRPFARRSRKPRRTTFLWVKARVRAARIKRRSLAILSKEQALTDRTQHDRDEHAGDRAGSRC